MSITFGEVFSKWYDHYSRTVSEKTSSDLKSAVQRYLITEIGVILVDELSPGHVVQVINHVAQMHPKTARRLLSVIIDVIDYAVIVLRAIDTNTFLRVGKYVTSHKSVNHRFIEPDKAHVMLRSLDRVCGISNSTKAAFWVLVYTSLRRSEVALAKKTEFDFESGMWTIPASRMKIKTQGDHLVPMSKSVVVLLKPLLQSNSEYMFSSDRGNGPIAPWSIYNVLLKSGWIEFQTLHGFRHIFSTHAHESGMFSSDAIELSLARSIKGVRGVYNHARMVSERVELMSWYANEVDKWRGITQVL